jgi:hypothetical protein
MHKQDRIKYYRKFVDQRNKALESILDKYRVQIADQLRISFKLMAQVFISGQSHHAQQILNYQISHTAHQIEHIVQQMRKHIYMLTLSSESEVLSRITDKRNHHTRVDSVHQILHRDLEAGGSISARVTYYLNGIIRRLQALSELAAVKGEKLDPVEIQSAFPRLKGLPKRVELHRMGEANRPKKPNITTDNIDEATWDQIVEDYREDYLPVNRGPEAVSSDEEMTSQGRFPSGKYDDATYDWELEQDITHDFVQSVRDGQNEASEQNGIVDMVWVAVLDNRTDECCVWRDGLTTTEIEAQLKDKHADDDCDAIVAPAHFNCRCSMEPVTDDLPDAPQSNKGDFDEWLNS